MMYSTSSSIGTGGFHHWQGCASVAAVLVHHRVAIVWCCVGRERRLWLCIRGRSDRVIDNVLNTCVTERSFERSSILIGW